MKKFKLWKRLLLSFCVVASLFMINLRLFTVNASANAVESFDSPVYTLGAPISCRYRSLDFYGGDGDEFSGVIPLLNVFAYDSTFSGYSWVGSNRSYSSGEYEHYYQLYYYGVDGSLSTSNVDLSFLSDRRCILSFYLDSPVIFKDLADLNNYFDFSIILNDVSSLTGIDPGSYPTHYILSYDYKFACVGYSLSNNLNFEFLSNSLNIPLSSNKLSFDFFNPDAFNDFDLSMLDTFYSSELDSSFYVLLSATVEIKNVVAGNVVLNSFSYNPVLFDTYSDELSSRNAAVINNDLVVDNINFSGIDWTDWLVNAVGGFLDFELVPGLSFAGMLGLLVGMSLFVIFLKVFAGG